MDAYSHVRNSSVQHVETWGPWETESALLREDTVVLSEAERDRGLSCWEKGIEE